MDDHKKILTIGTPSGNGLRILVHHLAAMGNVEGAVLATDECRASDLLVPDAQTNWDGERYGEGHGHLKQPFGKRRSHNPNRRKR
ncbi:hypothetical protein SAMN04488503_2249 [Humidesulfovibrio mexicanus]|uniref:Uncharacterized protein n=1 Tax=Humidesulfovibrio mexicanus TaxID=147047 RepID=A0A239AX72_9BACT|nr:hypothetical protein [Humidesulfovibrio mexicanus]SNR99634.1 hypothetical protein SAMN04488503_2249 [Humidesulfovibrio mexicanus]